ncbi:hypothetical protein LY90DRAFT_401250, partial [Neocallimastix californiae]
EYKEKQENERSSIDEVRTMFEKDLNNIEIINNKESPEEDRNETNEKKKKKTETQGNNVDHIQEGDKT